MSKDQAIAQTDFGELPQQGDLTWPKPATPEDMTIYKAIADNYHASQPAQPDCRTCRSHHELGCYQYMSNMRDTAKHCVNGDKYEAAPKVVLWRTE